MIFYWRKKLNVLQASQDMNITVRILKQNPDIFSDYYIICYIIIFSRFLCYIYYLYYVTDYLYYVIYFIYIIIYFKIIIFSDYYIDIFSDYYCHSSDVLNVNSKVFKNLRNEQIILLYKSTSLKVVLCHFEWSQYTRIYFGIVRKVKKNNWKWKSIERNFGKSFYGFCLCTSWFSNCRVECTWIHSKGS